MNDIQEMVKQLKDSLTGEYFLDHEHAEEGHFVACVSKKTADFDHTKKARPIFYFNMDAEKGVLEIMEYSHELQKQENELKRSWESMFDEESVDVTEMRNNKRTYKTTKE